MLGSFGASGKSDLWIQSEFSFDMLYDNNQLVLWIGHCHRVSSVQNNEEQRYYEMQLDVMLWNVEGFQNKNSNIKSTDTWKIYLKIKNTFISVHLWSIAI